ncbi:hypothetical protein DAEQUDRAFT_798723 [Daedalea quercina L-15889]|uniref:Uncharacterized protein n=1 Tax=Daedalea quercina L-15889 TaxID=1314783 RepID=A0A165MQF9_9APHY|nr:hypothetical protein DAEQUDRAFT_798723 [Daedalea quercina L-15889]
MAISHFRRHKEPPPLLRITRRQMRLDGIQPPYRVMSEEERALWASPYYTPWGGTDSCHLAASPTRLWTVSRLSEGLTRRHDRQKRSHDSAIPHPGLEAQITHLLRVRALQEFRMLVRCLKHRPRTAIEAPLLRRLTRAEWKELKATGVIPQEDAIAIIVVPPLNRDPATEARPEPSMASLPLEGVTMTRKDTRPLPPVSTLMPTGSDWFEEDPLSLILPQSKVPLYNGLALFPSPEQRASCHKLLTELLHLERRARLKERIRVTERQSQSEAASEELQPAPNATKRARGDEKGSHAFLLRSNAKTLLRADTVPLAIALWRIRLWEGEGWDLAGSPEYVGPWAAH